MISSIEEPFHTTHTKSFFRERKQTDRETERRERERERERDVQFNSRER